MKKTTFRNTLGKAKRIATGVSMLFALSAGTLFASDTSGMPDRQTPTAQGSFDSDGAGTAPRTENGIPCGNKKIGNATILWECRNVFAENTLYLYQAEEENGNEENFDANRHLKRISLPLKSNILLRANGHRVVRETETGVLVSAVVHGFEMFWEYNPKEERWTEYPSGMVFEEPRRGNVSTALWFLHALKRNGHLEGVSPKDYPVVCGVSSEEVKKGMSAKDLFEALRARERILREAILVEFSEDLSSTETPK